jgi:hypothetical protein
MSAHDPCPVHVGQVLPCRECELDAAEADPRTVKPINPETGRPYRHVPLKELVEREKQRLAPPSDTNLPVNPPTEDA